MKSIVWRNWHAMRIIRAVFGIIALAQGILQRDSLLIIAGSFLLFSAIFNVGCCGPDGCTLPRNKKLGNIRKIPYEEINDR